MLTDDLLFSQEPPKNKVSMKSSRDFAKELIREDLKLSENNSPRHSPKKGIESRGAST